MGKKVNFTVVLFILLLLAAGNVLFYFNKTGISLTGFSITDFSVRIKKPDLSTTIFLVQWFLLLIVVIIFYIKFLRERREEKPEKININIQESRRGTETDLDSLYNILRKKEKLRISEIAKTFKINSERALDWGKILENNELVSIDYPAFSEPEIMIKRGENEKEEQEFEEIDEEEDEEVEETNERKKIEEKKETEKKHKSREEKRKEKTHQTRKQKNQRFFSTISSKRRKKR